MLILNATGPKGEELAMAGGQADRDRRSDTTPEFDSATFDSDAYDEAELQGIVFDALGGIDSDWRSHLELADSGASAAVNCRQNRVS